MDESPKSGIRLYDVIVQYLVNYITYSTSRIANRNGYFYCHYSAFIVCDSTALWQKKRYLFRLLLPYF